MRVNPPILEFDSAREAMIEPWEVTRRLDAPEHCVVCFFGEVLEKVAAQYQARVLAQNRWEDGLHPLFEISYSGHRLAFFHPGVGAPLACGLLEEVIALGCKRFIACGGCGVLEDISLGSLIVVSSAVRDEGVSYHYLPAAREVEANREATAALEETLTRHGVPYRHGKTWTTDAPYRETRAKIAARKREGCLAVDMEASAMMAVAQFRAVPFGQVLYAGDDLSGTEWDNRGWQSRQEIREMLFWLAADACLAL
jgi:uridine phosphorylase